MADTVRVAVIGTGIGVEHVRAMQQVPGASVVGVGSARQERAQRVARENDVPRASADYHDFLDDDVDALVITTPQALHLPITRDALAAGKHVLCEKPLGITMAEAREMVRLADATNCVHMVNHHQRFGAAFLGMKQQVDAGYLGTPTLSDGRFTHNPADYLRAGLWSDSKATWFTDDTQGGGILAGSAGPHLIDMLCWMLGDVEAVCGVTAVTVPEITLADGSVARDITAPDGFLHVLRFASGALATIRGIPAAYSGHGGLALELNGTTGALRVGGAMDDVNRGLRGATKGTDHIEELPVPDAPWDRVGIATAFIEAIRSGGPSPAPNFHDGLRVQAIITALQEAAARRAWVAVERESPVGGMVRG